MREIKFRAISYDTGDWVYGWYAREMTASFIIEEVVTKSPNEIGWIEYKKHEIEPETLGQYTGLRDIHGTDIYEGDIVEYRDLSGIKGKGVVKYENGSFCIDDGLIKAFRWIDYEVEKISNVFDNPELLEERGSIMPHAKRLK